MNTANVAQPSHFRTSHDFGLAAIGLVFVLLAGCQSTPPVPPVSDPFANPTRPRFNTLESYVYQLKDGYYGQVQGTVTQRVEKIGADQATLSVTPSTPRGGMARNEIYTAEGNWVRHPLVNQLQQIDFEFSPALPVYMFPLEPKKSWSARVIATNPDHGTRRVRIDGKVLGAERIRVPGGEFDTIKIRRDIWAGDSPETRYTEYEWYSPVLGRAVRIESTSEWKWRPTCELMFCDLARGDWNIYEIQSPAPVL